ncbi:PHP domain-containing protein [Thermomicrobium sp. 4228-Ro]|uniref:PHP domain-containing protein n=1 Tax=Thermomicrobium sp. 4228-Ro TaxID=2993937 RepID=UPI002248DC99|nr:PHP domain-containing protein [Thermomicrobium sp. 4228-Ro]MCX2726859.1 PHP domain-containing protein [Thermomicrobium sp. 4228-Ro]
MGTVDLHTHTTASDGLFAPRELVQLAAERGIRVLAVTDHDAVAGIPEAQRAAEEYGILLVPGIELSTAVERGELHLLGYFIDPEHPDLARHLHRLHTARRERAVRLIEQLRSLGFPVSLEELEAIAQGGTITRAHAARLLLVKGYVSSIDEAFDRYLGRNRPAYVPHSYPSPRQAVEIVRAAGGVPVLAHPLSVDDLEGALAELIPAGLAGLEAWYGEYSPDQQRDLAALAERYGLIATGGSDYHGPGFRAGRELGAVDVPPAVVEALVACARRDGDRPATLPLQ